MLTSHEKARVRYFLGYPSIERNMAISLGFPSASHPLFSVQYAMDNILPEAEPDLRAILNECECTEQQMSQARSRLSAATVDKIKFLGPLELAALEDTLAYWVGRLADFFGVIPNPTATMSQRGKYVLIEEP